MPVADAPSPVTQAEETLAATCVWLRSQGLTDATLPIHMVDVGSGQPMPDVGQPVLGFPMHRARKWKKDKLDDLTKRWRGGKVSPHPA
jgi:hypothetical protein